MTRDDIIRMAIKCQLANAGNREGLYMDALAEFAELVAEVEREECIQIAHDTYEGFGASAQGVNFVKQRIMEEIRARGKND